jgi:uncharacterized protein YjbI with pentapeptide repeats
LGIIVQPGLKDLQVGHCDPLAQFRHDRPEAVFCDAQLIETDLSDANLLDAKITQKQLDQACGTNAVLPHGLTLRRACREGAK